MNEMYRLRTYGPIRGFEEVDEVIDDADEALNFAQEKLKITEKWMKQYEDRKKDTTKQSS